MAILSSSLGEGVLLMDLDAPLVNPTEKRPLTITGRVLEARFGKSDKVVCFSSQN